MGTVSGKRNITQVMDGVTQMWAPHVLGEVNDYDVKVANAAGDYLEHVHADTDEIFVVLSGQLRRELPDAAVVLGPMDVFTVRRGVRHRPRAAAGTRILMVEPRGTSQDGGTGSTGIRFPG